MAILFGKGDPAATDPVLATINELFPTYEAKYRGSSVYVDESTSQLLDLANASRNRDFIALAKIPPQEPWRYRAQLSDLSGCYDPAKIDVQELVLAHRALLAVRHAPLRKIAKARFDRLLEFGPESSCMCPSYEETKKAFAAKEALLKAQGLHIKATFTPTSHIYGLEKCPTP